MKQITKQIVSKFQEMFGAPPALVVRAPGRVNLIGEHTDYNDGFVLPLAIERAVWLALRPRADSVVQVHSLDFGETAVFDLNALQHSGDHWSEYVKGVAWALADAGYALHGWDGVMAGNVPVGAGLSSSAALELATARARWPHVGDIHLPPTGGEFVPGRESSGLWPHRLHGGRRGRGPSGRDRRWRAAAW